MKRLFVVNSLFSYLTCVSSRPVSETDDITVLVLFCRDEKSNNELEARMRAVLPLSKCVFLTDPDDYVKLLGNSTYMNELCRSPQEVRMFFTHNTWLHNRVFDSYPKAQITLYEEGLASYYPGLLRKYRHSDRINGVYFHNYLDAFVPPDAGSNPAVFGLIDRRRFTDLLLRATPKPSSTAQQLSLSTVVVVEQYLFKKGRAQSISSAADEYAAAIRLIVNKGYSVVYKRHPRESTRLFDLVMERLDDRYRNNVVIARSDSELLEQSLLSGVPAAVAAISSTSLLTVPQYFSVPTYRIDSMAPYDVAAEIPVERRGLVTNQIALTARVPSLHELPNVIHVGDAFTQFRGRFDSMPRLSDDVGLRYLGDVDFDREYVDVVRRIASSEIEVISFDLFDTLVKRPSVEGSDLFALLDEPLKDHLPPFTRFHSVRSSVWGRLNADRDLQGGRPAEYSLNDVYEYLADVLNLDDSGRAELRNAEVGLEEAVVELRRAGVGLTAVAEAHGKPWVVTSDTYFTDDELHRIALSKLPTGPHRVFTSLQEQKTKAAGDLFPVIVDAMGATADAVLHIGDRSDHDVRNAEKHGLQAAWFPSGAHAALSQPRIRNLWTGVREERASAMIRGLIWNEVFDNPFRSFDGNSLCSSDPELLGYMVVGPALVGWSRWILHQAARHDYDMLAFLSRDGYLPLQICRRLLEQEHASIEPELKYVLSSRRAMFSLFDQDPAHVAYTDLVHGLQPGASVYSALETRFGRAVADDLGSSLASFGPKDMHAPIGSHMQQVKNGIARMADRIVAACRGNDAVVRDYYRCEFAHAANPAIVDVGYSGSAQRGISLALSRPVAGLYFTTMEHNTEHAAVNGFEVSEFSAEPVYFRSGGLLEYLITPPGLDSCTGFDSDTGLPVLADHDPTDPIRSAVHSGIERFVDDYFRVFADYTPCLVMRPRLAALSLTSFLAEPTKEDALTLDGGAHEDLVAGGINDVFSYWPAGSDALQAAPRAEPGDTGPEVARLQARIAELETQLGGYRPVTKHVQELTDRLKHAAAWRLKRAVKKAKQSTR